MAEEAEDVPTDRHRCPMVQLRSRTRAARVKRGTSSLFRRAMLRISSLTIAVCASLVAACSSPPVVVAPTSPTDVGELRPGTGILKGYLAPAELPDSLALLPPPCALRCRS